VKATESGWYRVASAYADDQDHAQRLYDYISRLWFILPNARIVDVVALAVARRISRYSNNSVDDSLEGIVNTWNEMFGLPAWRRHRHLLGQCPRWLVEPVGPNGKTSGIIPFVRVGQPDACDFARLATPWLGGLLSRCQPPWRSRNS
jgi:ribonucleoside-diphosphate reductase alpha chain